MFNHFKIKAFLLIILTIGLLIGCGTRSISNSDYHSYSNRYERSNPFYQGELNELDVIGIHSKSEISEEDITKALSVSQLPIKIPKGSSIMLIQSGAMIPDEIMTKGLENYYNVSVFSGVPILPESNINQNRYNNENKKPEKNDHSRILRLAAAKGGINKLIVYWGLLETGRENHITKVISWLPFIGNAIPDESQRMRIRMKIAVVDVQSGQWNIFSPDAFENVDFSAYHSRESSDQTQVAILKEKAYKSAINEILNRYSK